MSLIDVTGAKESSFEPIPEGSYNIACDEAEVKTTKSGTGEYINCKFKIIEGSHEGRTLFMMFNIKNDNPKAVEIGQSQLKAFLKCSGAKSFALQKATDLVGMKVLAIVKIKHDDYGDKNVISYFKPFAPDSGAVSPKSAVSPTARF